MISETQRKNKTNANITQICKAQKILQLLRLCCLPHRHTPTWQPLPLTHTNSLDKIKNRVSAPKNKVKWKAFGGSNTNNNNNYNSNNNAKLAKQLNNRRHGSWLRGLWCSWRIEEFQFCRSGRTSPPSTEHAEKQLAQRHGEATCI